MSGRILPINFTYTVPTSEFTHKMAQSAPMIAAVSGLRWKIWAINEAEQEASGLYFFEHEEALNGYLEEVFAVGMAHNPMVSNIRIQRFAILEDITAMTRGPVNG